MTLDDDALQEIMANALNPPFVGTALGTLLRALAVQARQALVLDDENERLRAALRDVCNFARLFYSETTSQAREKIEGYAKLATRNP